MRIGRYLDTIHSRVPALGEPKEKGGNQDKYLDTIHTSVLDLGLSWKSWRHVGDMS